jgi:hypothetical protein
MNKWLENNKRFDLIKISQKDLNSKYKELTKVNI